MSKFSRQCNDINYLGSEWAKARGFCRGQKATRRGSLMLDGLGKQDDQASRSCSQRDFLSSEPMRSGVETGRKVRRCRQDGGCSGEDQFSKVKSAGRRQENSRATVS